MPLKVLREFARSEAESTSIRAVAEDAGVGRSHRVHKFIAEGTVPHPRVRRLLALCYLRRMAGVDETELVRPCVVVLEVLIADVPGTSRGRVTTASSTRLSMKPPTSLGFDHTTPVWMGSYDLYAEPRSTC